MGLDMYLNARRFLWTYPEDGPDARRKTAITEALGEAVPGAVKEVVTEAAYWRKANHIHAWFVKNVQGGTDDCGNYDVGREQLAELRDLCQRVLDFQHLANESLPTQEGFFFGSTDYDEGYFADCKYTLNRLNELLDDKYKDWDFQYHSSW